MSPGLCARLVCSSKRTTKRRPPADNPKGVLYLLNSIYIMKLPNKRRTIKILEPIKTHFNFIPQRVPPANTGFALYRYRQFVSRLCTKARVSAGTLPAVYTAGTSGICIHVCAGTGIGTGTYFPDASVPSVRRQYRYRTHRKVRYTIYTVTVPNTSLIYCCPFFSFYLVVLVWFVVFSHPVG